MSDTVPVCVGANAAGTAIQDVMTAFHAQWTAAPGGFTISNVVGSPVTSFTVTHDDGWQINYRVSGGAILSLIAPEGGVSNSASPGTPANAYAEDTLIPAPSGTGTRYQFAQYGDAILFAVNATANTHSAYAIHQGRILNRNNAVDALNGLATLAYIPHDTASSNAFSWLNSNTTAGNRKSYLRVGAGVWASPIYATTPNSASVLTAERIGPIAAKAPDSGTPSSATSMTRGLWRYLFEDTSSPAGNPLSVLPVPTSNQGWLRLNGSNSATRLVALWDKTVTP